MRTPLPLLATALLAALALAPAAGARPTPTSRPAPGGWLRCTIVGTAGNDVIQGTSGDDVICAGRGDDVVHGGGGNDAIFGQGGDDTLDGGAGRDWILGGAGDDDVSGGPGHDTSSRGLLRDSRNFGVDIARTYNVPVGTKVTYTYLGGNCTKNEESGTETVTDNIEQSRVMFTAIGDWTETFRCGFERSNGRFSVRFDTPGGNSQSVDINVDQDSSPNVWFRKFSVICESQSVPCHGQSDTVTADIGDGVPKPPVQFGPIPDEPGPVRPPTLECVGSITVDPIYPREDPICSSDGDPIPELSFEGLPPGVVGLRSGSGVTLRGSWPGRQIFSQTFFVKVIATTRGWRREATVVVTVNPPV